MKIFWSRILKWWTAACQENQQFPKIIVVIGLADNLSLFVKRETILYGHVLNVIASELHEKVPITYRTYI